VDEAIQATQAVIEQTRKVKEGLLQDLLTRGIGHTRFKQTPIGEIPEGWAVTTIGATLRGIVPGRSLNASSEPAGPGRWGVLKVSAVGHGEFVPVENKELDRGFAVPPQYRVKAGDILITRANTAALVGACCRVPPGSYELMLCDKTLRLEPGPGIEATFLMHVLGSPQARTYFARVATGSSASMKNISQKKIRALPVALPPLNEQRTIAGRLDEASRMNATNESSLARLKGTKAGLLQDLLTGKVRVSP